MDDSDLVFCLVDGVNIGSFEILSIIIIFKFTLAY
jgi:hypothetical protein